MQKTRTIKRSRLSRRETAFYLKNTSHLTENKIVIFLSFFLAGVNCILLRLLPFAVRSDFAGFPGAALLLLGFILIGVGFVAIGDNRPGMTGTMYAMIAFALVFLPVSLFLIYLSKWFIAVCFVEISIIVSAVLISISKKVKKKEKS